MAITIDTSAWTARYGVRPSGKHFWEFGGEGATVGRRKAQRLSYIYSTDGQWGEAQERALECFREAFGQTADITVRLKP